MIFYPRLFEISASDIKPYIMVGNKSLLLDPIDNDIVRRVENKKREDKITKSEFDSAPPKIKKYLEDYLSAVDIDVDDIDNYDISYGDFWDYQVEIAKSDKTTQTTSKTVSSYDFDEDIIIILSEYYKQQGKEIEWKKFLSLIPNGLIRQPLNELFSLLSKIVLDDEEEIKDEIKGERLTLNKSDQNKWKKDMIDYLYSFKEIEELNEGSFYKDEILKSGTFLKTLFNIDEKGVGRGEIMICYMFKDAKASGGGQSFDVILLNGTTYEVKEYVKDKGGIRLGTEGKLTRYKFWRNVQNSVSEGAALYDEYKDELKDTIQPFFYKIWGYIADDQQKQGKYDKAISAGVAAGELGDANLNILKMWYYLSHELVTVRELDLPEDLYQRLDKLYYINNPEHLDNDLEAAAGQYFNQNPDLDLFIVFRPDKVNIVDKEGFSFKTITQAAVKFLENELSNKDIISAKKAFQKWKESVEKTISEFNDKDDEQALKDVLKGTTYLDFYYKEQDEEYDKEYSEKKENEYNKKLKTWQDRYDKNINNPKKSQREKDKWINDNPKPELSESFYPSLS